MEKLFERLTGKRREKFIREEVPDLRKPIESILGQMRGEIEAGTYFLIIGDDASGRVPALVFDRFLKTVNKEKGYPGPQTIFVAGSGSGWLHVEGVEAEIKNETLKRLVDEIPFPGEAESPVPAGKRVLIVTDAIVTGSSLRPLMEALSKKGIGFDIAVMGFEPERSQEGLKEDIEQEFGTHIYAGSKNIYPKVLGKFDVSGVAKNPASLFSQRVKNANSRMVRRDKKIQQTVNDTRHDVALLSQKLIQWYKENK